MSSNHNGFQSTKEGKILVFDNTTTDHNPYLSFLWQIQSPNKPSFWQQNSTDGALSMKQETV